MEMYPEGTKFIAPSKDQLLNEGWEENSYGIISHTNFDGVFVSDMFNYAGKELIVDQKDVYNWQFDKETIYCWPVEECLRLNVFGASEITLTSEKVHDCSPGSTPLMGFIICKVCGKNIEEL